MDLHDLFDYFFELFDVLILFVENKEVKHPWLVFIACSAVALVLAFIIKLL